MTLNSFLMIDVSTRFYTDFYKIRIERVFGALVQFNQNFTSVKCLSLRNRQDSLIKILVLNRPIIGKPRKMILFIHNCYLGKTSIRLSKIYMVYRLIELTCPQTILYVNWEKFSLYNIDILPAITIKYDN